MFILSVVLSARQILYPLRTAPYLARRTTEWDDSPGLRRDAAALEGVSDINFFFGQVTLLRKHVHPRHEDTNQWRPDEPCATSSAGEPARVPARHNE